MNAKQVFKIAVIASVFGMSYIGVSITSDAEMLAGEEVTVHSLSISQAKACGSESGGTPWNFACNSFGRCALIEAGSGQSANCNP